jgi:hypothetical protein
MSTETKILIGRYELIMDYGMNFVRQKGGIGQIE